MQLRVLDFMALSLGMVASLRPAAKQLQPKRPPQGLCFLKNYVLVVETVFVSSASMAAVLILLTHQPWFQGGTGQNIQVIDVLSSRVLWHLLCTSIWNLAQILVDKFDIALHSTTHNIALPSALHSNALHHNCWNKQRSQFTWMFAESSSGGNMADHRGTDDITHGQLFCRYSSLVFETERFGISYTGSYYSACNLVGSFGVSHILSRP